MIGESQPGRSDVQALLHTLFDITILRRGPEDIPGSWIVLYLCIALWLLAMVTTTLLIAEFSTTDAWIGILSWLASLAMYGAVVRLAGFGNRMLQTQSALIGCGAVITFAMLAVLVMLQPFLGARFASIVAILVLFWSVPVKGHIIARAINQNWYAGIVIAMMIFILQYVLTTLVGSTLDSAPGA